MIFKRFFGIEKILGKLWTKPQFDLGQCNIVEPGIVSPAKFVPDFVRKPSYCVNGHTIISPKNPEIKTENQIACMRESCILAKLILNIVGENIKIGKTTDYLDSIAHDVCISNGAYPSPLFYKGFPKSICTSVNNVACHGIPDSRPLKDGDIINVDITVYLNGYHGDCSSTFMVGNVDERGKYLVASTKYCLEKAIQICGPGVKFNKIGATIETAARRKGLLICPSFCGHGIGEYFHGPPDIYHTHNIYPGVMLPGMTFTIEPVLSLGSKVVEILEDGWTAVTEDNSRTAQEEHTILITEKGYDILTK